MRENRDCQMLEIVRNTIITAVEESARLRRALQHERSAWADAERELIRFSRAIDDFERVILQTRIHFDVSDSFLHCENLVHVRDRLKRMQRIVVRALAENLLF